jgi:hypothetical protein
MAAGDWLQSRWFYLLLLCGLTVGVGWEGFVALAGPPQTNLQHPAIRDSAFLVVFAWAWGWPVMWSVRPAAEPTRILWTWGCLSCLFHLAVAFHVGHAWSHRAAYRHVEDASGFGPGLFVNYLFAAVWVADAAWAWVAFDAYLKRPAWVKWAVVGFMGFVVVNAAVVFGSDWLMRLFWVVWLSMPVVLEWGNRRWRARNPSA